MEREPNTAAYLLSGLFGPGVDERRRRLLPLAPETILAGTAGLTDQVSFELRERLLDKHPGRVARSLGSLARFHPQSASLRKRLRATAPVEVMISLDGADDDEAWSLRDQLFASQGNAVIESLGRISTPRAWQMREAWLADRGGEAALEVYETARVLAKSLTGLDDDRAWDLRKELRAAAPIAALASIKFLVSERSWKWRDRYLDRAPKTVFESLARIDDPRGWVMREKKAPLVKEAIDSLNELDGEMAWRLREQFADLWPSTVVKTLGRLASTAAGEALVARLLRSHPDNVSLLKHAAAIALGAHLDPDVGCD
jgi:dTMP kinase